MSAAARAVSARLRYPRLARWDAGRPGAGGELARALRSALGDEQVVTAPGELLLHGTDESFHEPCPPDVVVFARHEGDVVCALRVAKQLGAPVVPFGAGTSLEGHVAALCGGVSLDLGRRMTRVLAVHEADMDCRVQAGVRRIALNEHLRPTGLHFPVDPGADATIGGMAATNASGTSAVRYGTMRSNVIGLTVALEDGTVIKTGSRARKSSAALDLTSLLVGSEGVLGVITEVALRLHARPSAVAAAICAFDSTDGAVATVVEALAAQVPLARAELLDPLSLRAVALRFPELRAELPAPGCSALFLEFGGASERELQEQVATVEGIAGAHGQRGAFRFAHGEEGRARLWKARHHAYWASMQLRPGCRALPTDVCLPLSSMATCIKETVDDLRRCGLEAPLFGHVGDGNFHVILLAREDETEAYLETLFAFNDRLVQRALDAGGTCTGEHGVGYGKRKWLPLEHGAAVEAMRSIKRALDPDSRLNPGKKF